MDVRPSEAAHDAALENALAFTRPAAHLALQVVDGQGKGVTDAMVQVHLIERGTRVPDIDHEAWDDHNDLRLDSQGVLQVEVPSSIAMRLTIHGPHWVTTERTMQALSSGEAVDLGEIALAPANLLTGRVLDPGGNPVAKARISIEEANGSMWGNFGHKSVRSDEEGGYAVEGVRRGRYEIKVQAQGFAPLRLDAQEVDQDFGDFELDLRLTRGETTRGQVVDPDGNPIPDAKVYLVTTQEPMWYGNYRPGLPDSEPGAVSDQYGRFEVAGLVEEGTMYLGARAEGFGVGYADEVKPNGDAVIRLPKHYALEGKVIDGKGQPVAKATVKLEHVPEGEEHFGTSNTTSKEDGSFTLPAKAPGSYHLSLDSPFGKLEPEPIQLGPDTEPVELVLPVQHPLLIQVVDGDGVGLPGVEVSLSREESGGNEEMMVLMEMGHLDGVNMRHFRSHQSTSVQTDQDGVARFADLEAARYQLSAELLGYARLEQELDVSGVTQEEEITLDKGGILRVRLVDGMGAPVANVSVGLKTSEEGKDLRQQETDSAGRAVWNDLEEGEYMVSYRANEANGWWWDDDSEDELAPDQPRVQVEAGKVRDFELEVGDLALLTVAVTRHGQPASDVKVHLREVQEEENYYYGSQDQGRPTDGRGQVILPAVQAGTYDIIVKGRKSSPATEQRVELYVGPQTVEIQLEGGEVRGKLLGTSGALSGATVAILPYHEPGSTEAHRNMGGMTIVSYVSGGGRPALKFGRSGEQDTNTRSDTQGAYLFTDVPDGNWQIVARAKGYGTWSSPPITMRGGRLVDLGDHRLFQGAVIRGHDHNHVPRDDQDENMFFGWGESVYLNDGEGMMINIAMIDDQGDYLLEDLPEGTYTISKGSFTSEAIDLPAGAERRVDIPLEEPEEEEAEEQGS